MSARISIPVAVAIVLWVAPGIVLAGGTSLVYTYGGRFDLQIPADATATRGWMQDAVVTVFDHVLICDLNVHVDIRHTCVFDLQLALEGPHGTVVMLNASDPFAGYYKGENYESTIFDDEANVAIEEASPSFTGDFRPLESLSVFDGRDAYGIWSLHVHDGYYVNTGCLEYFALVIAVSPPDASVPVPVPAAAGMTVLGLILIGPRRFGGIASFRPSETAQYG